MTIDSTTIAAEAPVRRIEPQSGWCALNWREIWRYRELLYFLTWRDVKVRYKQTVLGVLWAVLQPLLQLVVFSVIFGRVAKLDSEGYPYPVFLYVGLLPWQFFSAALNRSSLSVVGGANLIQKVYFPRLIVPLASVGSCLVDFAIEFTILIGLMVHYHVAPTAAALMVVPLVALTILVALGMGTLLSALNAAYRDFRYLIPFGLQIWTYLSPVVYSMDKVPQKWRMLYALNPMAGIIDAYRSALLGKPLAWGPLAVSLSMGAALFLFGLYYFRRLESRFADIV